MIDLMVDLAVAKQCDFLLCAGDVFDKPNPNQQTKDLLLEKILRNQDVRFVFTVGNHDFQTKDHSLTGYHSLITFKLLQNISNVVVIPPGSLVGFNWGDILALPNPIEDFQSPPRRPGFRVVAFHGVVQGSNPHLQSEYTASQLVAKYEADYLALGDQHIHRKMAPNAWYPGCPVQRTYGCEEGLVLVELSEEGCKTEGLHLSLPKKVTLSIDWEVGKDNEAHLVESVVQNSQVSYIKLQFHLPATVWAKIDKEYIVKSLLDCGYLDVKLENLSNSDIIMRDGTKEIVSCTTIEEELKYIIEKETMELDKEKLLLKCLEFTS
jgi:DNA repair exonuclease SbcCD nuclease subunit